MSAPAARLEVQTTWNNRCGMPCAIPRLFHSCLEVLGRVLRASYQGGMAAAWSRWAVREGPLLCRRRHPDLINVLPVLTEEAEAAQQVRLDPS